MQPSPHGYTNDTTGDGVVVVKRYTGPDSEARRELERGVLTRLQGLLPVPPVLNRRESGSAPDDLELTLRFVHGAHGQDLLDAGRAAGVLNASGRILARIHGLDATGILPGRPVKAGDVLVHGDFGPNNLLLDPESLQVVAVLDWEWAHVGRPIEDLAWCEWIVRMHHPDHVAALDELFAGYGARPAWPERHAAMMVGCRQLIDFCERWEPGGDGVRQWRDRASVTASWLE